MKQDHGCNECRQADYQVSDPTDLTNLENIPNEILNPCENYNHPHDGLRPLLPASIQAPNRNQIHA